MHTHTHVMYLGQEEVFAISLEVLGNAEELCVTLGGSVASLGLVHLNHLALVGLGLHMRGKGEREGGRWRDK